VWWHRFRYALALVGLCALATCPQGIRACQRNQRSREADALLSYVADRALALLGEDKRFPAGVIGYTPDPRACCAAGSACAPSASLWDQPLWRQLRVTIDAPHRFALSYQSSGTVATLRATGDVDCNGVFATYEIVLDSSTSPPTRTITSQHPGE
jgi:hypothetical protein